MRRSKSFVAFRRESIAALLSEQGRVSVAELAEKLDISPLTVRRDLDYLEQQGIAQRRYGEALLAEGAGQPARESRIDRVRAAIARAAAGLVRERDSVFINTSTTALGCVPLITEPAVSVITNSGRALNMEIPPTMTLLLTGGEIRAPRSVMSGEFALNNIRMVAPRWCFLGCAGIAPGAGLTSLTLQEATVNALMIERSERHVVLTDSSKIGTEAGFRYADVSSIDMLITDTDAPAEALDELREAGVEEIVLVDPDEA